MASCHAIGDEANTIALNAVAATHAHGSIEHAQMLKPVDIPRFAELGLTASIQPQHAMDDRDVITRFWGNPAGIPYAFNSLHRAGIKLLMGSDAPVAPLDPWLAISAAVFGTESSDREPFQSEQCLDFETALASSTALGRTTLQAGDAADLVLLDCDPSALESPEAMRARPCARHYACWVLDISVSRISLIDGGIGKPPDAISLIDGGASTSLRS